MNTVGQPLKKMGFTLIELLIVVAIIAILAAIAVPNFLEAQTRSKVSRVLSDQRSLVTALEAYRVDNNNYPPSIGGTVSNELGRVTTPIAYITSLPFDPFPVKSAMGAVEPEPHYDYVRYMQEFNPIVLRVVPPIASAKYAGVALVSGGPDHRQEVDYLSTDLPDFLFVWNTYDPTNGTISDGDIYTFAGGRKGI